MVFTETVGLAAAQDQPACRANLPHKCSIQSPHEGIGCRNSDLLLILTTDLYTWAYDHPFPITIYTREINKCLDHRNKYLYRTPASFSQLPRLAMSKLPCEGPRKITIYISFLQRRMQMGNDSGLIYWRYSMILMVEMIWNDESQVVILWINQCFK